MRKPPFNTPPFTVRVVLCPACDHGIDPHGLDPGGPCGVGNASAFPCECMWSPNQIAAELTRPKGPEVMKTFTVRRAPNGSSVHIEADGTVFPWHVSTDGMTYERGDVLEKLTLTLLVERDGATFPEGWEGVSYVDYPGEVGG